MRPSEYRRFFQGAALAASIAIGSAALPSVAAAQSDAATAGQTTGQTTRTQNGDDDKTDWGWLGLLGLAGLLGLRRRDNHVHHTDTTTRRP
jgi:MYXO-CTERM domain-containing protein